MTVRHPKDVATLRAEFPALATLSDEAIQALYSEWSELTHCAGWLFLDCADLGEFREWLVGKERGPVAVEQRENRPTMCGPCSMDDPEECESNSYGSGVTCFALSAGYTRGYDDGWVDAYREINAALTVTQSEGATVEQQLATARRQIERVLALVGKGTGNG